MKDQWKFLPWWLLSKSEYNETFSVIFKHRVLYVSQYYVLHKRGERKVVLNSCLDAAKASDPLLLYPLSSWKERR